jgi:hypothetical protein
MQFIILVINSAGSEDSTYIANADIEPEVTADINEATVFREKQAWQMLAELKDTLELNMTVVPVRIEIAYPYTT